LFTEKAPPSWIGLIGRELEDDLVRAVFDNEVFHRFRAVPEKDASRSSANVPHQA
jgi:hypothetical protein